MKTTIQKKIRSDIPGFSALAALLLALSPAQTGAETVAYWRFDGDGTRVPTPGAWMRDTASRTTIDGRGIAAVDVSGNGNHLYAWSTGGSGFQYKADVSASVIPQTGENNQFSIQNAGSFPCAFTWSAKTLPAGRDVQKFSSRAWTVQASVKPTTVDRAYRTFLGRLGNRVVKSDPRMSAFYFQVSDQQVFAVKFADEAGLFHIVSDTEMPEANQWYHLAAVSDGSTLKLYKDSLDGQGYRLVGKGDLTSSPNPAMANPPVDSNGDTWSWSVGFCKYGLSSDPKDDNVDRFLGCVDEIMISDTALTPDKFLFSQPNRKTAPAVARTDSPASQAEASSPAAPAEAAKPIWKSPILYIVVLSAIAVVVLLFVIIQLVFAVKRTVK